MTQIVKERVNMENIPENTDTFKWGSSEGSSTVAVSAALGLGGVLVAPENTLEKRLAERRITPETQATFEIQPYKNGWMYPTPGGGLRWKNAKSNAEPKYSWLERRSEPANALYYASDLAQAVLASDGACWLVSGEPDLWALRSAGVNHAFSGFTEATINPYLIDFLQSMGVTVLYIAPDLDSTGARWASKVSAALVNTAIELDCRELPKDLGEHGDIGKAWQNYTRRLPFERYLLGLPRWYPEPEKGVAKPAPILVAGWGDVPAEYRQAICSKLGVERFNGKGWSSNKVHCPFHGDENPSASVHETKGLYCHTQGRMYKWVEVGEALGIGTYTQTPIFPAAATDLGLAVEAKAKLIQLGLTSLAIVLDVLYSHGWQGGETFTFSDIAPICSSVNVGAKTVRNSLAQLTGKSFDKRVSKTPNIQRVRDIFFRDVSPHSSLQHNEEKDRGNKSRGRPSKVYRLPTKEELYLTLRVEPRTLVVMPEGKIGNAADYKAEVTFVPVRLQEGDYPISQLAGFTGISAPTLRSYSQRADIEVTAKFERQILTPERMHTLPKDKQELAQARKDRRIKGGVWLETSNGKRYAATQESAAIAIKYGRVELVRQLANHYRAKER